MKRYIRSELLLSDTNVPEIVDLVFCESQYRDQITASISSKDISRSMVRVKSSNVWAYNINVRKDGDSVGDVYAQFKNDHGGPGDVYVLYDVPVKLYRKWVSAPSKGHFYWKYLRNNFKYSKLTGDKRGKLKNAVNH